MSDWLLKGQELLIVPGLRLSFQRFGWPEKGIVDRAPSSLGALAVGRTKNKELLLPLARAECMWIGLSVSPSAPKMLLAVAVELHNGQIIDALSGAAFDPNKPATVIVPDTPRVEGIRRRDGRLNVFAREAPDIDAPLCARVHFQVRAHRGQDEFPRKRRSRARVVALRLVDYQTFASETGRRPPKPMDPDVGYKGWLLP